jgi:hypothetical protein
MDFKIWLEHKKIKLTNDYKHCSNMVTKIENGEKIPYGRDYGASMFYIEAQLDLINEIQKQKFF